MKQKALVVREGGRLMARVERSEACQACRACKFGQTSEVFVPIPRGVTALEGDTVELELDDGSVGWASILAYAIPAALLMAGLFLGGPLADATSWPRDLCQAALALAGVAVGVALLRILEPIVRKSGRFRIRCERQEAEDSWHPN